MDGLASHGMSGFMKLRASVGLGLKFNKPVFLGVSFVPHQKSILIFTQLRLLFSAYVNYFTLQYYSIVHQKSIFSHLKNWKKSPPLPNHHHLASARIE